MRRIYFATVCLMLLSGCTLSMEEWEVPEEEVGKDEVATIETEYGSLSYQFADSVLYVTEKIQELYLVRTEADSILYFNSAMPGHLKPYVGAKLAASFSKDLPNGLSNRVTEVTDLGGILRVTTTRVSTKQLYQHLKFCFDAGVPIPDLDGLTEEELRDYGYELIIDPETGDSIIMDWNDYEVARGERPANAKRRSLKGYRTRGEDDEEEKIQKGKLTEDGFAVSELLGIQVDTRQVGDYWDKGSAIISLLRKDLFDVAEKLREDAAENKVDWKPYLGVALNVREYNKTHVEEDYDKEYELKYTDSFTEWEVAVEAGLAAEANFNYSPNAKWNGYGNADEMFDKLKEANRLYKQVTNRLKPNIKTAKSWNKLRIRFPLGFIGPVPIGVVIGATLTPVIEIDGSIAANIVYKSPTVRSGEETMFGKTEEFCDTIAPGEFTKMSLSGSASVKVGAGVRVYAGIEVGGTAGVTIGGNIGAYLEGDVSIDFVTNDGQDVTSFQNMGGNIRFHGEVFADLRFFVAPLGIDLLDEEIWSSDEIELWNLPYSFGPKMGLTDMYTYFGHEMNEDAEEGEGGIKGLMHTWVVPVNDPVLKLHTYYPGMKIFFGPISDNIWEYMAPAAQKIGDYWNTVADMGDWKPIEPLQKYEFVWRGNLETVAKEHGKKSIDEVHLMPIFYYYKSHFNPADKWFYECVPEISDDGQIWMTNDVIHQDVAMPKIETIECGHIKSEDIGMCEKGSILGEGASSWVMARHVQRYTFYTTVRVTGGSNMKEWGIDLKMYTPYKKRFKGSHKVLKVDELRSGIYTFVFTADSDWEGNKSLKGDNGEEVKNQIYFKALPYWNNPRAENALLYADDKLSTALHPIVYFKEDKDHIWDKIATDRETYGDLQIESLTHAE